MTRQVTEADLCEVGRTIPSQDGKCPNVAIHAVTNPLRKPFLFCDHHFRVALSRGLINDPLVPKAEFDRREAKRIADAN